MTTTCKFCGRTLECVGGYYSPLFESCTCGGREKKAKKDEETRIRLEKETAEANRLGGCTCGHGDYFRCPMHGSRNIAMMSCR